MNDANARGLTPNASTVLGNAGTAEDIAVLDAALQHDEPLVREHAAWALDRLASAAGTARPRTPAAVGTNPSMSAEFRAIAPCSRADLRARRASARWASCAGSRRQSAGSRLSPAPAPRRPARRRDALASDSAKRSASARRPRFTS
jgi:hypothetical protein